MRTCSRLSLTHCIFSKIINGHYHKPPFRRQHLRGKFLILNSLFHLKVCWCCIWSLFRSFDNFHFFLLSRILVTTSYLLGQKIYFYFTIVGYENDEFCVKKQWKRPPVFVKRNYKWYFGQRKVNYEGLRLKSSCDHILFSWPTFL